MNGPVSSPHDTNASAAGSHQAAPLWGMVLAGGEARRMGRDKGTLSYYGEPQALHCLRLLETVCAEVRVSVRAERRAAAPYAALPLIIDSGVVRGPAAGLAAAFEHNPDAAWLLLAVDMPRVDQAVLERLIRARNPRMVATAFRHPDGTPEPLCAIWEPSARETLSTRIRAGKASLRRILETSTVRFVTPDDPAVLTSVDSMEDYQRIRSAMRGVAERQEDDESR